MKDFFENLKFSLLMGSCIGFVIGIGSVYIDSSISNVLNAVSDVALIGARNIFGVGFIRSMSSPHGLLLIHILLFSCLAVLLFFLVTVLHRILRLIGFSYSVKDFFFWGFITACFFFYIFVWFHITRFLTYSDALSIRGLQILFVSLAAISIVSLCLFLIRRHFIRLVGDRASSLISRLLALIDLILIAVLCFSAAISSTNRIEAEFEKVETGLNVIIVGLDAATTSFINPLLDQGRLENMRQIIDNGSWGQLRSSTPLKSPVIWTTIATGQTPQEHGVSDYLVKRPGKAGSVPVTSLQRNKAALWNIVSTRSTVGVVNWWATWPAESVNGFMLSNRFNAPNIKKRCFPKEITLVVDSMTTNADDCDLSRFTDYRPTQIFNPVLSSLRNQSVDDYLWNNLCEVYREDNLVFDVAGKLQRRFSPQLMCVYVHGIDNIQHRFFRYHPHYYSFPFSLFHSQEQGSFSGKVIDNYYEFTDSLLINYTDQVDENTVLIIISDHGAGPLLRQVTSLDFNRYFEMKGWLKRKGTGEIDLENTLAYSAGSQPMEDIIKIYLGDKYVSDPDSLSHFKKMLKTELKSLQTKKGEMLVKRLMDDKRAQADLVLKINKWICGDDSIHVDGHTRAISDMAIPLIDVLSGEHRINGIIMMTGGPVKKKTRLHGVSIFDIAPTVLYLLGYPVADDMEGRIITEALSEKFKKSYPVRVIPTYDSLVEKSYDRLLDEEGADEKMMEKLRALGYIE